MTTFKDLRTRDFNCINEEWVKLEDVETLLKDRIKENKQKCKCENLLGMQLCCYCLMEHELQQILGDKK